MHYTELYEGILQELRRVFEELKEASLTAFVETIKSHNRIFFIGVGREGMVTRAFAMRLMHMGKSIFWVWDDTTPAMEKGDLLVATSGSGEIGHIDYVCRKAKEHGAFVCLITGSPSGDTAKHTGSHGKSMPEGGVKGRARRNERSSAALMFRFRCISYFPTGFSGRPHVDDGLSRSGQARRGLHSLAHVRDGSCENGIGRGVGEIRGRPAQSFLA